MTRYDPGMQGTFAWQGIPVTEDLTRVDGIIAGCGEAALLVILNGLKGLPTDPTELGDIIRQAEAKGWAGKGGTSAPHGLESLAGSYGVTLQSGNFNTLVNQYAGTRPIIVGVSNARAFGGRDAGVFGHYVTIVGRTAGGALIVNDPNQSSKFGFFDVYTVQEFMNAHPFWAAVPSTWQGGGGGQGGGGTGGDGGGTPLGFDPLGGLGAGLMSAFPWLKTIGDWISGPNTWFNAQRILKLVAGIVLIFIAFQGLVSGMGATIVNDVVPSGVKNAAGAAVPATGAITKAAAAA